MPERGSKAPSPNTRCECFQTLNEWKLCKLIDVATGQRTTYVVTDPNGEQEQVCDTLAGGVACLRSHANGKK